MEATVETFLNTSLSSVSDNTHPIKKKSSRTSNRKFVKFRDRDLRVIKQLTIGEKTYDIVKVLGRKHQRFQAFDQYAGPQGDMRCIHVIPQCDLNRIRLLQRLADYNRNIPMILEFEKIRDLIYLVFPWIWGTDLQEYLRQIRKHKRRRPSVREVCLLFNGFAHGLTQFHNEGFVHGDLKPENLIVCRAPPRLVMIDFGSSWRIEHAMQRGSGDGVTSGKYIAPELIWQAEQITIRGTHGRNRQDSYAQDTENKNIGMIDDRNDQFSFSVMFYEMLTMEYPYENMGGLVGREENRGIFDSKLIPPSRKSIHRNQIPASIWRKIDRVVTRGLAIHPDARYPGRRPWLEDLDEIKFELKHRRIMHPLNGALNRVIVWFSDLLSSKDVNSSS